MHADGLTLVHHLRVAAGTGVRGANGDVVGLDTEVVEALLHRDADGAAAAPQPDEEIGPETGLVNIRCQLEGILQEVVRGNKSLIHCYSLGVLS